MTITSDLEVISIRNLSAGYDGFPVLEDINLSVTERDFIGLIGPNGAGKTTLFRVLLGLLTPSGGEISILGENPAKARRQIGYVPQVVEFDSDFPINVSDVVQMGRLGTKRLFQRISARDKSIIEESLNRLDLWELRDRAIGELSVGQRQRVYIARALAAEPKILLLDEPTESVDPQVHTKIYELLRELNESITIMLISHDLSVISTYVKTIGCLNKTLHYHGTDITPEILEEVYHCPVDLIAHGDVPHRVLHEHTGGEQTH
jgi:zinc transport system ATP-binding protein